MRCATSSPATSSTPWTAACARSINPATGEVIAEVPEGTQADVDRAVAAAKAAFPGWRDTTARRARARDAQARRPARGARRGALPPGVRQRRQADGGRPRGDADHRRQRALLRRRGARARGPRGRRVHGGLHEHGPARADRRRGPDRAVELPADDGDLEDRPGAGDGQHDRPQAVRADPAHRAAARRARRGGAPARRAQRDHGRRRAGRRRARAPPRRAPRLAHRLGRDRQVDRARPPRTRSSACTSSSAARRRWSCSTTPTRPRWPRASRSPATSTPARTARRRRGSSPRRGSTTTSSRRSSPPSSR